VVTAAGIYTFAIRVQQSGDCITSFVLTPTVKADFTPATVSGQLSVSPSYSPLVGSQVLFSIAFLDKFGNNVCDVSLQPLVIRLLSQNSQIFLSPNASSSLCIISIPWLVSINGTIVAIASFSGSDIINTTIVTSPGYASPINSFAAIPAPIFAGQSFTLLISLFDSAGNPTVLVSGMVCQTNPTIMSATTVPGLPLSVSASGTLTVTRTVLMTVAGQYTGTCSISDQRMLPAAWPLTVSPGNANATASSLDASSCQNATAPVVCVVYLTLADAYGNALSSSAQSLNMSISASPSLPTAEPSFGNGRLYFTLVISSPGQYVLTCSLDALGLVPPSSLTIKSSATVSAF